MVLVVAILFALFGSFCFESVIVRSILNQKSNRLSNEGMHSYTHTHTHTHTHSHIHTYIIAAAYFCFSYPKAFYRRFSESEG